VRAATSASAALDTDPFDAESSKALISWTLAFITRAACWRYHRSRTGLNPRWRKARVHDYPIIFEFDDIYRAMSFAENELDFAAR